MRVINEDWEHEAQREIIYLQEDLELDKQELLQEREPAKIIIVKTPQDEHKQMADFPRASENGIFPRSDVPADTDRQGD